MKTKQATNLQSLVIYVLIIGVIVSLFVTFMMSREASDLDTLRQQNTNSESQPQEGQLEVSDT